MNEEQVQINAEVEQLRADKEDIMAMKEIPLQPNDHKTLRWKFYN